MGLAGKWMALAGAVAFALSAPAHAATVSGPAKVVDGDSLEVNGQRIRLFGIDAPEGTQKCDRQGERWACGEASAEHLRGAIGGFPVTCRGDQADQYKRLVAVCSVDGVELNRYMVSEGWATAFRQYSEAYVADETRARASRLGIWSSEFEAPQDYRAEERQALRVAPTPRRAVTTSGQCLIKGNRNRRGEWIYHLPGEPYYEQTRPEEMFCTEAQAQAAGYRPSRAYR